MTMILAAPPSVRLQYVVEDGLGAAYFVAKTIVARGFNFHCL